MNRIGGNRYIPSERLHSVSLPIENRYASLVFKIVLVVISAIGLFYYSGIPMDDPRPIIFSYFTIQSNILCLVYFLIATIYCAKDIKISGKDGTTTPFPRVKGMVILAIFVTFLIYNLVLNPGYAATPPEVNVMSNFIVHLIIPIMAMADWVLFDERGRYKRIDPALWLVFPLFYVVYTMIRAQVGGPFPNGTQYPYPFLNLDELGVGTTLISIILLALLFLILGYVIYYLDRWLGKRKVV